MKEGFFFGLGMMIGLLTPSAVIFIVLGMAIGLKEWILSRRRKTQISGSACSESSKVLVFQTESRMRQPERTDNSKAVIR